MSKKILITGSTSGIGKAAAEILAAAGHNLILVNRNETKARLFMEELQNRYPGLTIRGFIADFASFESIRKCAAELLKSLSGIDVLINNAGIFNLKRHETSDGFEQTFAVNYLAPYLFTNLILPLLENNKDARIVNIGSNSHYFAKLYLDDLSFSKRKYSGFKAYSASRLATVFFTQELARRLEPKKISVNCIHPGHVATNIWKFEDEPTVLQKLLAKIQIGTAITPEEGAQTVVYCTISEEIRNVTGSYFANMKIKAPSWKCHDINKQKKLWDLSAELTGLYDEPL